LPFHSDELLSTLPVGLSRFMIHVAPRQVLPADIAYRKSVEALANFRIAKANEIEDVCAALPIEPSYVLSLPRAVPSPMSAPPFP